jgi:hypothetical protein
MSSSPATSHATGMPLQPHHPTPAALPSKWTKTRRAQQAQLDEKHSMGRPSRPSRLGSFQWGSQRGPQGAPVQTCQSVSMKLLMVSYHPPLLRAGGMAEQSEK